MNTRQRRAVDELVRAFLVDQSCAGLATQNLLAARDELAAALDASNRRTPEIARAAIDAVNALVTHIET